jgi:putative ABC transport system permease protein
MRSEGSMENFFRDLRYGFRSLNKDRRLAFLAIFALALGIGSTTVIFSVIEGILLSPFPYKNADRLTQIHIYDANRSDESGRVFFSVPEILDIRQRNHVFEDVIATRYIDVLYRDGQGTQQFDGAQVTSNTFEFLHVLPLLGRLITSEDGQPDAPPVFAMSYRLWSKEFNRDAKVVGRTLVVNGEPRTLVAVMPPRFLLSGADIWIPQSLNQTEAGNQDLLAMARLKLGVSLQAASADLDVIARRLSKAYPKDYPERFSVGVRKLVDDVVGPFRSMIYMVASAVVMLLLIACTNVANLLLARATTREKEIAIRASIGASRGRLIGQLLTESFVLAAPGCLAGCLLAYGGLQGVLAVLPPDTFPAEALIALNPPALLFAVGVTILSCALFGLAPALHAVRGELNNRLKDANKGANGGFRHGGLRGALVIAEVSLSIVLLVSAGLMMRGLFALEHVNIGFNPIGILSARTPLPRGRYDTAERKRFFFRQVLQRLSVLPGVVAATETSHLPPYGGLRGSVTIPGKTHSEQWEAFFQLCSEKYFQTLGLRLLRGRLLSEVDVDSARQVAVINQTLAHNFFAGDDPIGRRIKFNLLDQAPESPRDAYFEVVGVVADAKNRGLRDSPMPEAFLPYTVSGFAERGLLVRTAVNPLSMVTAVRREIWAVDPDVAVTLTGSLESYLERFSYAGPRFGFILQGIFAAIGLLLVAIGVFSVMAYTVSLETHEVGIRMVLGAQSRDVLLMVLLKGIRLITAGVLVGLCASFVLTRLVKNQIWGVSATDPWAFGGGVLLVVGVGLAACLFPARRATKADPLFALRYE